MVKDVEITAPHVHGAMKRPEATTRISRNAAKYPLRRGSVLSAVDHSGEGTCQAAQRSVSTRVGHLYPGSVGLEML